MQYVGRKLVLDWGDGKIVSIEILVKEQSLYAPKPKNPLLFDIYEALGERVEKSLGESAEGQRTYGQEISMLMPVMNPSVWRTKEEEAALVKRQQELDRE